LPFQQLNILLT
jgi:hypothetical protein